MSRTALLLFDIDGTLMDTRGAGYGALLDAVEDVFELPREQMPPLDLAGATDGGVLKKMFADARVPWCDDRAARYLDCYLGHLHRRMNGPDFAGHLLPGVEPLLSHLAGDARFHLALLTGNVRRGAMTKLSRFGIDHYFIDGAFGDDHEDRNALGPVAIHRLTAHTGRRFEPNQVVIIGDTPKDVACAAACGAHCLAVATGSYSVPQLEASGQCQGMEDLTSVQAVLDFLSHATGIGP